jgi:hypothetical protein
MPTIINDPSRPKEKVKKTSTKRSEMCENRNRRNYQNSRRTWFILPPTCAKKLSRRSRRGSWFGQRLRIGYPGRVVGSSAHVYEGKVSGNHGAVWTEKEIRCVKTGKWARGHEAVYISSVGLQPKRADSPGSVA